MDNGPGPVGAIPPPPGSIPNFDHPTDLIRTRLFAAIAVMAVVITISFLFRLYSKAKATVGYHNEDWACSVAYVMLMSYYGTVLVMVYFGEVHHAWDLTKEAYKNIMLSLYIGSIIYCPAAYFTKVTLLLFEARVFSVYQRIAKAIRAFIVLLAILYTPVFFTKAFYCIPVAAAWDSDIKPAKCLNQRKVFLCDMALGILTDIVILVLPMLLASSLQIPLRTKIKIVALLSAGGAATCVSILRLCKELEYLETTDATEGFFLLNLTTSDNARKAWFSMRWSKKTVTTLNDLNSQETPDRIKPAIMPEPKAVYQSDLDPNCGHITGVSRGGVHYEDLIEQPGGVMVPEEALIPNYAGLNRKGSRETE
ncbi:hypothetical protein LY78DRAFT_746499 [Colletotrichum sublineola]|nr:hypothetical protein LY78DRAFT_746499 [Colletotrichum sublineola]